MQTNPILELMEQVQGFKKRLLEGAAVAGHGVDAGDGGLDVALADDLVFEAIDLARAAHGRGHTDYAFVLDWIRGTIFVEEGGEDWGPFDGMEFGGRNYFGTEAVLAGVAANYGFAGG